MHVEVDERNGHGNVQKRNGIPLNELQTAVRLRYRVLERVVADIAFVQKEILERGRTPAQVGRTDVSFDVHFFIRHFDVNEARRDVLFKDAPYSVFNSFVGGQIVNETPVVLQNERDIRIRERHAHDRLLNVPELRLRTLEELPARRHVKEDIADFDRRSDRAPFRENLAARAPVAAYFRALAALRRPAYERQVADLGDRRERLAAKAERMNPKEVVRLAQFARRVRRERQNELVGRYAAPVVDYLNRLDSALLDFDLDARRARVDRILDELLNDVGGPFDHFARRDLINHAFREFPNDRRHSGLLEWGGAKRKGGGKRKRKRKRSSEVRGARRVALIFQ